MGYVMSKIRRCDVCREPATSFARDVITWPSAGPTEEIRCGCDDHPAKSIRQEAIESFDQAGLGCFCGQGMATLDRKEFFVIGYYLGVNSAKD